VHEPGWLIKENGVEVYRESTNGGSDSIRPAPVTYTYDLTTKFALVDISSTITGDWKFGGVATASNGKVIFAPYNADGVGVFDPSDNSFALVDIASTITGNWKFGGAAAASNGKVIFAPHDADGVGVFDPNAPPEEAFTLVDIASTISAGKFFGAAAASNGKIIFAPYNADGVGVFDPSDNSVYAG